MKRVFALAPLLLAGCDASAPPQPISSPTASPTPTATADTQPPPPHIGDPPQTTPPPGVDPAARNLTVAEWRKAENFDHCAPLALRSDQGAGGKARRANFAGGWGVAFDTPVLRSAYGFAGSGDLDGDDAPAADRRARLAAQWPLFRDLEHLPAPAFAGYGVEGAGAYPSDNPDGRGLNSLAFVYIGGQRCMYNVWSRLGRAHLEHMLENLEVLKP